MKLFLAIVRYLPLVMNAVLAVEQTVQAPGKTKAQVALGAIQAVSTLTGDAVPEEHVQTITHLIDGIVDVFNRTGVFTKGGAPVAAP